MEVNLENTKIARLLALIDEAVADTGSDIRTWQKKRDIILSVADAQSRSNLEEFASWFGDDKE